MGTKNNPGQFDCYGAAAPDEPIFILRATDISAPSLVVLWALRYKQRKIDEHHWYGPEYNRHQEKYQEAINVANAMKEFEKKISAEYQTAEAPLTESEKSYEEQIADGSATTG